MNPDVPDSSNAGAECITTVSDVTSAHFLTLGISGPSGSGKTTLVKSLLLPFFQTLGYSVQLIHGDSCFQGSKCAWDAELHRRNVEVPSGCNYDKILKRIQESSATADQPDILLVEGFVLFCGPPVLQSQFDLRFFLHSNKETCYVRRRDRRRRKNLVAFDAYFEKYVWPSYLEHHSEILHQVGTATHSSQDLDDLNSACLVSLSEVDFTSSLYAIETSNLRPTAVFRSVWDVLRSRGFVEETTFDIGERIAARVERKMKRRRPPVHGSREDSNS